MSSESDSDLDFESADEGNKLDSLDDISLSDESDAEESIKNKKPSISINNKQVSSEEPSKDTKEELNDAQVKKESEIVEKISQQVPVNKIDEPQEDLSNETEFVALTESTERSETNRAGGFEIEELPDEKIDAQLDKEIDRIENKLESELTIVESHVKATQIDTKVASETVNSNSEEPKVDKEAKLWASGWDDMDFSDVEDDNEKIEPNRTLAKDEPIKMAEVTVKKSEEPKKVEKVPESGGWSWSKFGSSLLSTAASSGIVASLTTQINEVLESVEATIGAPDPLELALKNKSEREQAEAQTNEKADKAEKEEEEDSNEITDWNSHSDWFSVLPNKLATTGKHLVNGSLDVLENVGKKTIEVLHDKDPNLRNTREFFKMASDVSAASGKTNLSELLREAKGFAENSKHEISNSNSETHLTGSKATKKQGKICFASYFDEFKGLVYLEALEMLSFQTNSKLEMKMLSLNKSVQKQLDSFKNIFDLDKLLEEADEDEELDGEFDFENLNDLIIDYFSELNLKISIENVVQSFKTASLGTKSELNGSELHDEAIKCLALISSKLIEFFHKTAEMALVQTVRQEKNAFRHSYNQAENIYNISKLCVRSVTSIANDFNRSLKKRESVSNQLVANIFLEASNCNIYVGDGFMLLAPVFKTLALDDSQ